MNSNWSYSPETPNLGQIRQFLEPCDLEIWQMTLKNNRAPLQLIHWFFIWGFQRSMAYQADLLEVHIQHTGFNATSSFVHHLVAICEFKLDLQSRNAQFGSKSTIFFSCVTLQFYIWPWKTIGHLFYVASSFVHRFITTGEFKLEL